jgi:hypothetical protein
MIFNCRNVQSELNDNKATVETSEPRERNISQTGTEYFQSSSVVAKAHIVYITP